MNISGIYESYKLLSIAEIGIVNKIISGALKLPNSYFAGLLNVLNFCNLNKILTLHILLYYK